MNSLNNIDRYSVWIVPSGKVGATLQNYIDEVGAPLEAPHFVPHITLIGNISAGADELRDVRQNMQELVRGIGAFSVSLTEFGMMDEENRSLFLRAQSDELETAYKRAAGLFPQANTERFRQMPHLSLLYGMFPAKVKERIIADNPLASLEFTAGSFDLYRTNTDKSTWKLEQEFPLS